MALTHTLGSIHIPAGCTWTDEFDWSPVDATSEYTLSGALIIDQAVRQAGRPITLEASDDQGWHGMTRTVLSQIYALAAQAGAQHVLTLADGRQFDVVFRPGAEPITARPLVKREVPPADWPYIITLRLTEV